MESKNLIIVMLCLGMLIAAHPGNAQLDCVTGILPSLLPCQNFLTNLLPILPSSQCCAAAGNFSGLAPPQSLCQCLKLNLLGNGLLPFKLQLIPNLCSITGLLPNIVSCVLEPSKKA